jgi:hypothetical protein
MSMIQFESVVEDDTIRIPAMVTVTLLDTERARFRAKTKKELPGIEDFPAMLDTTGWKFDREEAHERC